MDLGHTVVMLLFTVMLIGYQQFLVLCGSKFLLHFEGFSTARQAVLFSINPHLCNNAVDYNTAESLAYF